MIASFYTNGPKSIQLKEADIIFESMLSQLHFLNAKGTAPTRIQAKLYISYFTAFEAMLPGKNLFNFLLEKKQF